MADAGVIIVTVVGAVGEDGKLSDEKYLAKVGFPSELSDAEIETKEMAAGGMKFRTQAEVELKKSLTQTSSASVTFLEYRRIFMNSPVGKGRLELGGLLKNPMGETTEEVAIMAKSDKLATVTVTLRWKDGSVPDTAYGVGAFQGANSMSGVGMGSPARSPLNPWAPMAGTRPTTTLPDPESNTYRVLLRIKKAKDLMSHDNDTQYDPFVKVSINGSTEETSRRRKTNNPYWDEELSFRFENVKRDFFSSIIRIEVCDHRYVRRNRVIGQCAMDAGTVYAAKQHYLSAKWLVLHQDADAGPIMGFLQASVLVQNILTDPIPEDDPDAGRVDDERMLAALMVGPGCQFTETKLLCDFFKAEAIPKMDAMGGADPYVKISFGAEVVRTHTVDDSRDPEWNESKVLSVFMPSLVSDVVVALWDEDSLSSDDLVATTRLPLRRMISHRADVAKMLRDNPPPLSPECQAALNLDAPDGLPHLPAQYVNFYGPPRTCDPDFHSLYQDMAKGTVDGCDFRARLLMRIDGAGKTVPPATLAQRIKFRPEEMQVKVVARVMVSTATMLPSGSYKLRLTVGTAQSMSDSFSTQRMHGDSDGAQYIDFNAGLEVTAEFSVVRPGVNDPTVTCEGQVPDVFLHLVPSGKLFAHKEPVAYIRFNAAELMRAGTTAPKCMQFVMVRDPGTRISTGHAPSQPLVQLECTMRLVEMTPPDAVTCKTHSDAPLPMVLAGKHVHTAKCVLDTCVFFAQHLPTGDDSGLSDPYITVAWANGMGRTGTKRSTLAPMYNELVRVEADAIPEAQPDVIIDIWDWDRIGRDDFLCRKVLPFAELAAGAAGAQWVGGWTDSAGKVLPKTRVLMRFDVSLAAECPPLPAKVRFPREVGSSSSYEGYPIPEERRLRTASYRVHGDVVGLRKMVKLHFLELQRPSVDVEVTGHRIVIPSVSGSNPTYNHQFEMNLELPENPDFLPEVTFRVCEHRLGMRQSVGATALSLGDEDCDRARHDARNLEHDQAVRDRLRAIKDWKRVRAGAQSTTTSSLPSAAASPPRPTPAAADAADSDDYNAPENYADGVVASPTEPVVVDIHDDGGDVGGAKDDQNPGDAAGATRAAPGGDVGGDDDEHEDAEFNDTHPLRPALQALGDEDDINDASFNHASGAGNTTIFHTLGLDDGEDALRTWYEKFDPDDCRPIPPDEQVARLRQMGEVAAKHGLPVGAATAEDFFGPFNSHKSLPVVRGHGDREREVGNLLANIFVEKNPTVAASSGDGAVPPPEGFSTPVKHAGAGGRAPYHHPAGRVQAFVVRVYIMSCDSLPVMDHGLTGNAADPYVQLTLTNGGSDGDNITVKLKEEVKYQTLNPQFFISKEMRGLLPTHTTLRVMVRDWDRVGADDVIGWTDIDLEERWYSSRGYNSILGRAALAPGSYTEKRQLRDAAGGNQGEIEMWVDMFPADAPSAFPVPPAIHIAPPPPIPLELRVTVWQTRDVGLVDNAGTSDAKSDIYVRACMVGMEEATQDTDVHYHSTDGTGFFNWRMVFPFTFEPASRKVLPQHDDGFLSELAHLFSVRREAKRYQPTLKVQVFDNDLLPGTDDFIGEVNLELMELQPVLARRMQYEMASSCPCGCWPFTSCCLHHRDVMDISLREKEEHAVAEARRDADLRARERQRRVDAKYQKWLANRRAARGDPEYQPRPRAQRRVRKAIKRAVDKEMSVDVFASYYPTIHGNQRPAPPQPAASARSASFRGAAAALVGGSPSDATDPPASPASNAGGAVGGVGSTQHKTEDRRVFESHKYWFAMRAPDGGYRVGDVQLSFQIVRLDTIKNDPTLTVGLGRDGPQPLPDPERPDGNFSSPWIAFLFYTWRRYRWYVLGITIAVVLIAFVLFFADEAVRIQSQKAFGGLRFKGDGPSVVAAVQVQTVTVTATAQPDTNATMAE